MKGYDLLASGDSFGKFHRCFDRVTAALREVRDAVTPQPGWGDAGQALGKLSAPRITNVRGMHQFARLAVNHLYNPWMTAANTADRHTSGEVNVEIAVGIGHGDTESALEHERECTAPAGHRLVFERGVESPLACGAWNGRRQHSRRIPKGKRLQFSFCDHTRPMDRNSECPLYARRNQAAGKSPR